MLEWGLQLYLRVYDFNYPKYLHEYLKRECDCVYPEHQNESLFFRMRLYLLRLIFICCKHMGVQRPSPHSTVTLLARLRGLSTSVPRAQAVWYASNCSGTTCKSGLSAP